MPNFIPPEVIQELMHRADIVEVVGDYVAIRRRGRNHFGLCPFHEEDTPSFSVNQDKQIFKCFGCGKGGNVISFVQEMENLTFVEAVQKLAQRYGVTIPEQAMSPDEQRRQQERQAILAMHDLAAKFYASLLPQSRQAQAYLTKRGVDAEAVQTFGLGVAPESDWQALSNYLLQQGYGEELLMKAGLASRSAKNSRLYDKFHGRLIFPIRDHRGVVVAFGGRAMGDEERKYINSENTPIFNKSQMLYGLDLAGPAMRSQAQVVVMEGYIDVLSAWQYGVKNAVASMGTAFTDQQVRLLHRSAPESPARLQVLLAFDGDAAGVKATLGSLEKLSSYDFIDPRVVIIPEQLDPDDFLRKYGLRGWERLLERYCYPMLDYLLLRALQRHDIKTAVGKGQVVAELQPALNKTRNQTERDSFIRELSRRLQVSEEAIRADLQRGGRGGNSGNSLTVSPELRRKPAIVQTGKPANRQLLALSLSDKNIFASACAELGEDFASTDQEAQLITLIESLGDDYDFQPASLLNYIDDEKEGLRDFLLKLIDTEIPSEGRAQVAEDVIRLIKSRLDASKLEDLQRRIEAAEAEGRHEEVAELIGEKLRLKEQLLRRS